MNKQNRNQNSKVNCKSFLVYSFGILSIFFIFTFLLLPSSVSAATINKPTNYLGMVGYWPFDGRDVTDKVYDRSGNNNNGTYVGAPTSTAKVAGRIGQALDFGPTVGYVGVQPSVSINNLAQFTVSAWIKPRSAGENNLSHVFSKGFNSSGGYLLRIDGLNRFAINIQFDGGTNLAFVTNFDTSTFYNEWHHIVMNWDGTNTASNVHVYLDGVELAHSFDTNGVGNKVDDSSGLFYIGENGGNTRNFDGIIDDARMYNRVLSPQEVLRHYNNAAGSKLGASKNSSLTNGLVGMWSFDERDVTDKVYDRSGQNNHGTFVGGATSSAKIAGRIGQALQFDGVNDHVGVGTGPELDFPDTTFSYSFWFYHNSSATSNILSNRLADSAAFKGYSIFTNSSGLALTTRFIDGIDHAINIGAITFNNWHHVTVVWDRESDTLTGYINGVRTLAPTDISTVGSIPRSAGLSFGDGEKSPLLGGIDDVRFYNRALSASEAKQLYNLGGSKANASQNTKSTNGLVGLWSFDGPDVTDKVYDRSGQNNHGTFVGGATSSAKVAGRIGQALTFDGVNDWVNAGDNGTLDIGTSDFSISFWHKVNSAVNVMGKTAPSGGTGGYIVNWIGASTTIRLNMTDGVDQANPQFNIANSNEWNYYTFSVNRSVATGISLYVNGVLKGCNGNCSYDLTIVGDLSNTNAFVMGTRSSADPTQFMDGSLDDVRVYNRALGAEEVRQLYNLGR